MVRYLIIFLTIILFGCKTNGEQIIKPLKLDINEIKFNAVSKNLTFENLEDSVDSKNMKNIIKYWYDNKIKTDGFEGSLDVIIKNLSLSKFKEIDYFKFTLDLEIIFIEKNEDLNKTKTYKLNTSEFGEIRGNFSINDQESLVLNIMYKSLNSINQKLLDIN